MDFDEQLRRYFATTDIGSLTPAALDTGIERMQVEFWLARDRGQRFALWALMHMLDAAPDLEIAFTDATEREAARNFIDMIGRMHEG